MTTDECCPLDDPTPSLNARLDIEGLRERAGSAGPIVARTVILDASLDQLWRLVSTSRGLSQWFADGVDGGPVDGPIWRVVEGDDQRMMRIDSVQEGSHIGFTVWRPDDPADRSTIEFDLEQQPDGRAALRIVETRTAGTSTVASARDVDAWEVRVLSLWACTVAMALVQ